MAFPPALPSPCPYSSVRQPEAEAHQGSALRCTLRSQEPQTCQCSQTRTFQPILQEGADLELLAVPSPILLCGIFCRCQSGYHNLFPSVLFWDYVL